jgi:eukaryotic-like serine/threonine-protein kinase
VSNDRPTHAVGESPPSDEREANAPSPLDVEVSSERNVPSPKTVPGKIAGSSEPVVRAESDIRSAQTIQAPGDQSDPIVGRHVMDWRISHRLGEGGMGTVYLALHKKMGERRKKVVKVLPADSTPTDKERFFREAEVAADVGGDERVVQIDTYDQWPDGRAFILMEFIEGLTLQQEIARSAPFTEEKALKQIAHRVVDTMAMLHAAKIVHRDLKPSNIMLPPKRGGGFRVKLIDFGVAKPPASLGRFGTDRRIACGTPGYWSPEAASAMEIDARTDVFSLGVILFEMLTGDLPFPVDGDMMAGLTRLLTETVPSINVVRAQKGHPPVNAAVEALVGQCLARKSAERPWMDEVHRRLSAVIERLGVEGVVKSPMATMRSVAPPEILDQLPRPSPASGDAIAEMSDMLDRMSARPASSATIAGRAAPRTDRGERGRGLRPVSVVAAAAGLVILGFVVLRKPTPPAPAAKPPEQAVTSPAAAAPPPLPPPSTVKPSGRVRIISIPTGATVRVDGQSVGRTPVDVTGTADALMRVQLDLAGFLSRSEAVMPTRSGGDAVFELKRANGTHSPTTTGKRRREPASHGPSPAADKTPPAGDEIFD